MIRFEYVNLWLQLGVGAAFHFLSLSVCPSPCLFVQAGEIVVFNIKNRDIPIVHRILKVHEDEDGQVSVLTKGDNNQVHDRGLYSDGQMWLERDDIVGTAVGALRYVGMVTIWLNDYPSLKYLLVRSTRASVHSTF